MFFADFRDSWFVEYLEVADGSYGIRGIALPYELAMGNSN